MARKLPTFSVDGKEWTLDTRLQEFRFVVLGKMPEFVPFNSPKGLELMELYEFSLRGDSGNSW